MSPTPGVRPALPEDADAFAACHLACWREAYEELWGPERFDEFDLHRMATRRRKEIESGAIFQVVVQNDHIELFCAWHGSRLIAASARAHRNREFAPVPRKSPEQPLPGSLPVPPA